jgi:hypothetical protein
LPSRRPLWSHNCPSAAVLLPPFRQTGIVSCTSRRSRRLGRDSMHHSPTPAENDWMRTEEISSGGSAYSDARFDPHFGSRPIERSERRKRQLAWDRPSIGRRMFRFATRFTIAVLIGVGATLGWQSYSDVAGEMLVARAPTLAWLVSISTTKPPIAATTSTSQTQQLEPLASNLDAVRLSVAQLAARQDQMAQRITALQVIEEDIRQKISLMPPFSASASQDAAIPQQKPAQPKAPSPSVQPSSVPRPPPAGPVVR